MKKAEIEARTEELLQHILEEGDYELWDVEYVKEGSDYYLRVYIDRDGGVTIDDCVTVTRALNERLDEDDYIEDAYILEVSSPGLTRRLKKDKELRRSIGRLVRVKLYKAETGAKEYIGRLRDFNDTVLTVDIDGNDTDFSRNNISSIRLEYED